ncbi:hypothetical protein BJY04DRAFT_198250 [Aspergillus karnatakaensis]|uniref:FAD-dependent oxidoreductase n=1 Tax=Aspergillus karnatakaensis TaxID=1810916 RepID=UPI003CCD19DD
MASLNLRPCKVIIVGSGFAGLALALMLDRTGVDYVLLEAYDEIVAQASAGIIMLPNGLRILDQLGCYESLLEQTQDVANTMAFWNADGETIASADGMANMSTERHGYPMIWFERSTVLQAMYDQISDKSKLLPQKRVETIRQLEESVEVVTVDGSTYRGDLVIGADGTHSRVRQEMVRQATELGVGEEYGDGHIATTYACLFGVCPIIPELPSGFLGFGLNKHFSLLVGTGAPNKTYFALAQNLGKSLRNDEVPRFTEEDKQRLVQEHWHDKITPSLTLGDLYKCHQRVIHTPLREGIHKKWHLGRIMTIGDASHHMTVVIGQGGNQAIESAAALTNSLVRTLSRPRVDRLATEEIQTIFQQVQELREPRVRMAMEMSAQRQRQDAMETPELEDLMVNKFPKMFPGAVVKRWESIYCPAVSLQMLKVPVRPRVVPFDDEREKDGQGKL